MTKILLEGKKDVRNNILTFHPSPDPKKPSWHILQHSPLIAPFSEQAENRYHSLYFFNQQTQNTGVNQGIQKEMTALPPGIEGSIRTMQPTLKREWAPDPTLGFGSLTAQVEGVEQKHFIGPFQLKKHL